jgi:RES domain-containing protein
MLTVWRMTTAPHVATAFSGEGARRYGGCWNPKGIPMVYTAGSQSLAMLEMLVQDDPLRAHYVMIPVTLPDRLKTETLQPDALPPGWRTPESRPLLQTLGADWCQRRSSAVLAVPSAVIPSETNYLLNPLHPAFGRIRIGTPEAFITDLRLVRR